MIVLPHIVWKKKLPQIFVSHSKEVCLLWPPKDHWTTPSLECKAEMEGVVWEIGRFLRLFMKSLRSSVCIMSINWLVRTDDHVITYSWGQWDSLQCKHASPILLVSLALSPLEIWNDYQLQHRTIHIQIFLAALRILKTVVDIKEN